VKEAVQLCPESASLDEIAAVAIKCNVFHTMRSLLKHSDLLRDEVNKGKVQIQGAIYDIMTGQVEFLDPLEPAPEEASHNPEEVECLECIVGKAAPINSFIATANDNVPMYRQLSPSTMAPSEDDVGFQRQVTTSTETSDGVVELCNVASLVADASLNSSSIEEDLMPVPIVDVSVSDWSTLDFEVSH